MSLAPSLTVAHPVKFSQTPCNYSSAPPHLGSGTQHVLQDILGMSDEQIMQLADKGVT